MGSNGWLRLELRYLAALEAISTTGSFGGAADALGYTQSAISQQIAALERLVGQPLIDRPGGRRPVGLTQAGELLLGHARGILGRARLARSELDALLDGSAGTLRVGTYQSVGIRFLPAATVRLAATEPELSVDIHEAACDLDLVQRVREGELDVAFSTLPPTEGPLATAELFDDEFLLLVPADWPERDGSIALETLATLPLIGYRNCRTEQRVESYLRGLGIDLTRVALADDNAIIQGMVAEGRGFALLTELSIDHDDPRTAIVRLADWVPPRRITLSWRSDRGHPVAVDAFVRAACEVARERRSAVRPAA